MDYPKYSNKYKSTILDYHKHPDKYKDFYIFELLWENSDIKIVLINAWNEWVERMHIEPSEQRGDYYLNLIKNNL